MSLNTESNRKETKKLSGYPLKDPPPRTHITVRSLTKRFAGVPLYEDFDLDVPKHKVTCIFGPNGCGKSTLINMIAGLIPIDNGTIRFDGMDLKDITIGYVFQNYRDALLPWKSAINNITYALKVKGWNKDRCDARVQELVEAFDIGFNLELYPYELSGGQQQLVSIMRALAPKPDVLLLDEPFSALDYEMTLFIRDKLQEVFDAHELTIVIVSHDLEEAVFLADEVLLLTKPPTCVADVIPYNAPRPRNFETLATADFIETRTRCLEIFQREVRR
ncbi:MAG TPA: ABC transporter ATP-binding protein [Alphaproteobacteria bacterium]|nr:ABC transporter ATP-binding protein [Alphaproteobacteria bacterium]